MFMGVATERRTQCKRCDWSYWQEPLTDEQGRYVDLMGAVIRPVNVEQITKALTKEGGGEPTSEQIEAAVEAKINDKIAKLVLKGKSLEDATEKANAITPIMVWRQSGDPCLSCRESSFRALRDGTCADGRCQGPRDCPRHSHLYAVPPLEALGTVDEAGTKAVMLSSDCTVVAGMIATMMQEDGSLTYEEAAAKTDPETGKLVARCRGCMGAFHYPEPDAVREDGTKKIEAYHRGDDAFVFHKLLRRPKTVKKVKKKEEETFGEMLSGLLSEDRLNSMARRCLMEQAKAGHRVGSYGEGLFGPVSLDIDPEARLEALDRSEALAALVVEQAGDMAAESPEDDGSFDHDDNVDTSDYATYDADADNTDTFDYDETDDGRSTRHQHHDEDDEDDGESIDLGVWL
jgi:hypothetical protein